MQASSLPDEASAAISGRPRHPSGHLTNRMEFAIMEMIRGYAEGLLKQGRWNVNDCSSRLDLASMYVAGRRRIP